METQRSVRLDGKVALVTGSTRGIGEAIARGFAAAGARVWVHGRDRVLGERIAAELEGRFVAADLARPEEIAALVERIASAEAKLDVLINNAGHHVLMPIEDLDMTGFDLVWRINVRAPVELLHRLLPLLRAAPSAAIVNVTSIHDTVPYAHDMPYCAAKAALAMVTRTLAIELAPLGIRINNLAPGAVETDINREILDQIGRDTFAEWIPLGRVARTDEMVGPALFLASEAASYVTGATLYADGAYRHHLVRYRHDL
ncbi:MAG: SDR family NAD(P)-dependent oxidoreductase [Thermomicrobiales bacterium]